MTDVGPNLRKGPGTLGGRAVGGRVTRVPRNTTVVTRVLGT